MIRALMGDIVTRVRYGPDGKDRFGHPVRAELSRATYAARVQRRTSDEGREFVTNAWVVYLPRDADVRAADALEWRGLTFQVDGSPEPRTIPGFPSVAHLRAYLVQRED